MSILHKAGLALIVLGTLGQTTSAHAMGFTGITVTPAPVTGGGSDPFTYSYTVTPDFNVSQFAFTFSDPNVTFASVTGPLNTVNATTPGSFVNFSSTGGTLAAGTSETITFTSPDGPRGGTFVAAGTGTGNAGSSNVAPGPTPVPEASTTVSLGLLLALGLGGVIVAARRKVAA
jgi:hypothetical protein